MKFYKSFTLNKRIKGIKPSRIIKKGFFKRTYIYDFTNESKYRDTVKKVNPKSKLINFSAIRLQINET